MKEIDFSGCPIMSSLSGERIKNLFEDIEFKINTYKKGDIVARQGSPCKYLNILLAGSVKTEMVAENGSVMTIENITAVRPLASAFLFAENNIFPVDVIATDFCRIISIPRDEVLKMFQKDAGFLESYIKYNSNKTQFLSTRLQTLNIKTIKGKLAFYILEGLNKNLVLNPGTNKFRMDRNQTELAKYFGVSRPALARCISEMEDENIILIEHKEVKVINRAALQNLLG